MEIVMKDSGLRSFQQKDVYTWDEILGIIQELEWDIERLEEEIEDIKQDRDENYQPIPKEWQY